MMAQVSETILRAYLRDSLIILERSLDWSRQQVGPAYRVAAAQLR
jgi:hypothetical protein